MTGKHLTLTALAATFALGATAMPGAARDMRATPPAERGFVYLLKSADTDKDGQISEAEMIAFHDGRFAEIDVDGDGLITPGEFADFRQARMAEFRANNPRPERIAARDGGARQMVPNGKGKWDGERRRDIGRMFFVRADADRSGQVSQAEFAASSATMFSRLDRNGEMVITIDDLPDRPMRW